jgi:hypothetical protein
MYKHIKSKFRNMTLRGDDKKKTFLGGGEGKPFFFLASIEYMNNNLAIHFRGISKFFTTRL